jgi:hypothetical protein
MICIDKKNVECYLKRFQIFLKNIPTFGLPISFVLNVQVHLGEGMTPRSQRQKNEESREGLGTVMSQY